MALKAAVVGVGHLGHLVRVNERDGLNPSEAGVGESRDHVDLVVRRQDHGLVLESVPWSHFDDLHSSGHCSPRAMQSKRCVICDVAWPYHGGS